MIRSKMHLPCVHRERITIQLEMQLWVKTMLVPENLPDLVLGDVFDLSVSLYHNVRSYAQGLLFKILGRTEKYSHKQVCVRGFLSLWAFT